jgi:hypothetical protein
VRRLGRRERLCIGVGDDKIDALQAGRDHVVDGVTSGAADAEHSDTRLQFAKVGDAGHVCSRILPARRIYALHPLPLSFQPMANAYSAHLEHLNRTSAGLDDLGTKRMATNANSRWLTDS